MNWTKRYGITSKACPGGGVGQGAGKAGTLPPTPPTPPPSPSSRSSGCAPQYQSSVRLPLRSVAAEQALNWHELGRIAPRWRENRNEGSVRGEGPGLSASEMLPFDPLLFCTLLIHQGTQGTQEAC